MKVTQQDQEMADDLYGVLMTEVQIIQSLDGGVLQQLFIHQGLCLTKGQALARIDDTRFRSYLAQQKQKVDSIRADIITGKPTILEYILTPDIASQTSRLTAKITTNQL